LTQVDRDELWIAANKICADLNFAVDDLFLELNRNGISRSSEKMGLVEAICALGHMNHLTNISVELGRKFESDLVAAMIMRSFLETWWNGTCLLLGDTGDYEAFIKNAIHWDKTHEDYIDQQAESKPDLRERFPRDPYLDLLRQSIGMTKTNGASQIFKNMVKRAETLLDEIGQNLDFSMYEIQYRRLSNLGGVHPTPNVLSRYASEPGKIYEFTRMPKISDSSIDWALTRTFSLFDISCDYAQLICNEFKISALRFSSIRGWVRGSVNFPGLESRS